MHIYNQGGLNMRATTQKGDLKSFSDGTFKCMNPECNERYEIANGIQCSCGLKITKVYRNSNKLVKKVTWTMNGNGKH